MQKGETPRAPSMGIGILGCFGGMLIQLVIGSLYQWGIVNIYLTSYFRSSDSSLAVESTGIVFPLMFISIGLTIRTGLYLSEKFHPLIVMGVGQILQALTIFISSYMSTFWSFIAFYGILFGLASGNSFMVPIHECNKYLVGKKMIVNGIILMGTGLGSVVFGEFSYNFINPERLAPLNGYYLGTQALQDIAMKAPTVVRWLSLLYVVIGLLGVAMITPVCLHNRRIKNEQEQKEQKVKNQHQMLKHTEISELRNKHDELASHDHHLHEEETHHDHHEMETHHDHHEMETHAHHDHHEEWTHDLNNIDSASQRNLHKKPQEEKKQAESVKQAMKSKIFWIQMFILFFGTSGCFLINGNYKTYVKKTIQDDQFLTLIGVIGAIGNGGSRFFWNLLFSKTGYKTVIMSVLTIAICVFSTIRFTTSIKGAYLIEVFLINVCLGGFLVTTPTSLQYIYGSTTGANIYGFVWQNFAFANFLGYIYVSQLSKVIGFNNVIYIALGMCVCTIPAVIFTKFQGSWKNDTQQLEFFVNMELEKQKADENKLQSEEHLSKHDGEHKFKSTHKIAAPNAELDGPSAVGLKLQPLNSIKIKPRQD